jgi:adenylate cyclase
MWTAMPEAKPRGPDMPVEIERKFLVTHDGWRRPEPGQRYRQGYLCNGEVTVRVRRAGSRGFLTIKGTSTGLGRPEFEYEIPAEEAEELFKLCRHPLIEKVRHAIPYAGLVWHVDEFAGENAGLLLAEVELQHPGQSVSLPDWIGEEVTADERYRNSHLVDVPQGVGRAGRSSAVPNWQAVVSIGQAAAPHCPTMRGDTTASPLQPLRGMTGSADDASATGQRKDAQEEYCAP